MILPFDVMGDGMLPIQAADSAALSLGLALPADTPFESWRDMGKQFGTGLRAAAFCIGDWLIFGDRKFRKDASEAYDQAIDSTGLDRTTLHNYAWVARAIPIEERNPLLSFEHHRALAPLPKEKRDEWGSLVSPRVNDERPVSVRRLRASIRIASDRPRIVPPEEIVQRGTAVGHDNHIPHLSRLVTVLRKTMPGMDEDQLAALKDDLAPLLELIGEL